MPRTRQRRSLFRIPEDENDLDDVGPVAWIAILRDDVLLLDVGEEPVPDVVIDTAQGLLMGNASEDFVWKGLKYTEVDSFTWSFCCVFNSQILDQSQAKAWLKQQADWTATVRQVDSAWLQGEHHACQSLFGKLMQDRLQDLANQKDPMPSALQTVQEEVPEESPKNPSNKKKLKAQELSQRTKTKQSVQELVAKLAKRQASGESSSSPRSRNSRDAYTRVGETTAQVKGQSTKALNNNNEKTLDRPTLQQPNETDMKKEKSRTKQCCCWTSPLSIARQPLLQ